MYRVLVPAVPTSRNGRLRISCDERASARGRPAGRRRVALPQGAPSPHCPLLLLAPGSAIQAALSLNILVGRARDAQTHPCSAKFRVLQSLLVFSAVELMTGREGAAEGHGDPPPSQIVLPWLTMSDKEQEQTRAAYTIAHLLRFICNFPELLVSAGGRGASWSGDLSAHRHLAKPAAVPDRTRGWSEHRLCSTPMGHCLWPRECPLAGHRQTAGLGLQLSAG